MLTDDEIEYWFTANGNHIPVKKGQSNKQAFSEFLKSKGDVRGYSAKELKEMQMLTDSIFLPDEQLPYSIGAKWINTDIQMPDGSTAHFVEGSKIVNKEVFAGKGCKRKIDCIDRLIEKYGGNSESWQKVKGIAVLEQDGETFKSEIHWYEEPNIGRVETKSKRILKYES
ncbi:MAG: hypothetical protein IJ706_03045 [Clostridia bacterium]|nr:hypothetical protein [Clostridia bacterium]